jgi:hypothetical protein
MRVRGKIPSEGINERAERTNSEEYAWYLQSISGQQNV